MTTNSHMFTVLGTTFGAFCAASFFALSFIFLVIGHYGSVHVQGKNSPANIATLPPCHFSSLSPLSQRCVFVGARETCTSSCVRVCARSMKGARAAEVQSLVHVLKCSPRDGQYYPCLLHQQGPGARAGSWPFVSKQMEMGRGEERWRIREEEVEEEE